MQALTWDSLDSSSYPEKNDPLITLDWTCTDFSGDPCVDVNGTIIALAATDRLQIIPANTFTLSKQYQFTVTAAKLLRSNSYTAVVNIIDYTIPVLNVSYPITIHSRRLLTM